MTYLSGSKHSTSFGLFFLSFNLTLLLYALLSLLCFLFSQSVSFVLSSLCLLCLCCCISSNVQMELACGDLHHARSAEPTVAASTCPSPGPSAPPSPHLVSRGGSVSEFDSVSDFGGPTLSNQGDLATGPPRPSTAFSEGVDAGNADSRSEVGSIGVQSAIVGDSVAIRDMTQILSGFDSFSPTTSSSFFSSSSSSSLVTTSSMRRSSTSNIGAAGRGGPRLPLRVYYTPRHPAALVRITGINIPRRPPPAKRTKPNPHGKLASASSAGALSSRRPSGPGALTASMKKRSGLSVEGLTDFKPGSGGWPTLQRIVLDELIGSSNNAQGELRISAALPSSVCSCVSSSCFLLYPSDPLKSCTVMCFYLWRLHEHLNASEQRLLLHHLWEASIFLPLNSTIPLPSIPFLVRVQPRRLSFFFVFFFVVNPFQMLFLLCCRSFPVFHLIFFL